MSHALQIDAAGNTGGDSLSALESSGVLLFLEKHQAVMCE